MSRPIQIPPPPVSELEADIRAIHARLTPAQEIELQHGCSFGDTQVLCILQQTPALQVQWLARARAMLTPPAPPLAPSPAPSVKSTKFVAKHSS